MKVGKSELQFLHRAVSFNKIHIPASMFYKRVILWKQGIHQRTINCRVYKFGKIDTMTKIDARQEWMDRQTDSRQIDGQMGDGRTMSYTNIQPVFFFKKRARKSVDVRPPGLTLGYNVME